jgi:hypothetical protein
VRAPIALHRHATQRVIRLVLAQSTRLHQQSLGALDELALGQFLLRRSELTAQLRDELMTSERYLQDDRNALELKPVNDIRGSSRTNGMADRLLRGVLGKDHQRKGSVAHRIDDAIQ